MRTTMMSAMAMGLAAVSMVGLNTPETKARQEPATGKSASSFETQWRGLHIMSPGRENCPS